MTKYTINLHTHFTKFLGAFGFNWYYSFITTPAEETFLVIMETKLPGFKYFPLKGSSGGVLTMSKETLDTYYLQPTGKNYPYLCHYVPEHSDQTKKIFTWKVDTKVIHANPPYPSFTFGVSENSSDTPVKVKKPHRDLCTDCFDYGSEYTEEDIAKTAYKRLVAKLTTPHRHNATNMQFYQQNCNLLPLHCDHIFSKEDGYNLGIPAEVIAHPGNLQWLTESENTRKGCRSDISAAELFQRYLSWETSGNIDIGKLSSLYLKINKKGVINDK
jgi:hypothetical protein